jgi:hypothetical protein
MKSINLAIRFALELCGLAALAYWGYQTGNSTAASVVLAILAPLVMIVIWGAFVAPRSRVAVPKPAKAMLGLAILLLTALALADAGWPTLAIVFGIVATINAALMSLWDQ